MTIPGMSSGIEAGPAFPAIHIGPPPAPGIPLNPLVAPEIAWVKVDLDRNRPDMFEIAFNDRDGDMVLLSGLIIGTDISIWAPDDTISPIPKPLMFGEVTNIEAICEGNRTYTIFRGYDHSHRLRRVTKTNTYMYMSDADIIRMIAAKAAIIPGMIEPSLPIHEHISQIAQTDWDFLTQRAQEIGYEIGMEYGTLFFRKVDMPIPGVATAEALASMQTLTMRSDLISFRPKVSAANINPRVEVRVWNPNESMVMSGRMRTATSGADLRIPPDVMMRGFGIVPVPSTPRTPGPGMIAPPPDPEATVIVNKPVDDNPATSAMAAQMTAMSMAEQVASGAIDAEGTAWGDPDIKPGAKYMIFGVPKPFDTAWTITTAVHEFQSVGQDGYRTRFTASGVHDRSLLGLMRRGAGQASSQSPINGLVLGIVTNVNDLLMQNRVKVTFPWLDPNYESDWARVVQLFAGPRAGAMFLPEVGDQVMVGFEFGDLRRPYILGGVPNMMSSYNITTGLVPEPPVLPIGYAGEVVWRGLSDPAGNRLAFHSQMPPRAPGTEEASGSAPIPPILSEILLGTGDNQIKVHIDETENSLTLQAAGIPPRAKNPVPTVNLDVGTGGAININGGTTAPGSPGTTGQININGMEIALTATTKITISAPMVSIESPQVTIN